VNRKTIFAALACALLAFSMLGCGTSNKLQSITLTANASATTGGFYNLIGEGGTLQLVATGNYSSQQTHVLTNVVTYNITPIGTEVNDGTTLLAPPNTVTLSPTGLLTAVTPFVCTWEDVSPDPTKFAWFLTGSYTVTATYQGFTSQPIYIGVASQAGNPVNNGITNNPSEQCGPTS
jgi:hypothetical protein